MNRGCVTRTAGAIILVVVAVPWVLPILLPLVIGFIWCAAACVSKAFFCCALLASDPLPAVQHPSTCAVRAKPWLKHLSHGSGEGRVSEYSDLRPTLTLIWLHRRCRNTYMSASRDVKRFDNTTRSPVYAFVSATLKVRYPSLPYPLGLCC